MPITATNRFRVLLWLIVLGAVGCGDPERSMTPETSPQPEGAAAPVTPGAEAPAIVGETPPGQIPPACSHGENDDYLHPERFYDAAGAVACPDGVVIFDHHITPKFLRTIIPYIEQETGALVDTNQVDFYITLPETGEQVVFQDIFNWYPGGTRAPFVTNVELWRLWRPHLEGEHTHTFGVKMIHRPTGADVSILFKDHTEMILYFDGLS